MEISECPQCGAAATPSAKKCEYCKAEFFITSIAYLSSFDSSGLQKYMQHYKALTKANPEDSEGQLGLGLCYLQLGMFPLALKAFDNVINSAPDIAQAYYYRCLSIIAGRRIKTLSLKEVREIEAHLNTAIQLGDKVDSAKLLLAMTKHDYYICNGMVVQPPTHCELLAGIDQSAFEANEIDRLRGCAKVADYSVFGL
jgi:tetratricopeptide (TPR) repeat protein